MSLGMIVRMNRPELGSACLSVLGLVLVPLHDSRLRGSVKTFKQIGAAYALTILPLNAVGQNVATLCPSGSHNYCVLFCQTSVYIVVYANVFLCQANCIEAHR